jgi:predicted amidohydrolase YtcJ/quercetin dioxygenase-like cupin family protein
MTTMVLVLALAQADLVLTNGRVYTLDPERPWAEAVAMQGERILAVGTNAEIGRLAPAATRVIDLRGAFASPGFNDAHVHVDSTGALLIGANLLDVHTEDRLVERIRGAAERLPKGSWILRGDWGAYEKWGAGSAGGGGGAAAGPFTPDRRMVDPVTPDHPVLISRFDRSMHLANSLALKLAGITETTAAPPGGEIARDTSGRLTGILKGSAFDLVRKAVPQVSFEQRLAQVRAVLQEAREGGVTTVQDLSTPEQVMAYQELRRRGELTLRINIRPQLWFVEQMAALGFSRGFGDDWLRLVGFKAWVDGIMGNSQALFFQPFNHDPRNRGALRHIMFPEGQEGAAMTMTEADHYTRFAPGNLEKLVKAAAKIGVPPHVHAIGDLGNRILLDVYERVLTEEGLVDKDHRWRVIHAQHVHPDDFARFGRLKLVAEVNPYHVADDMRWMEERIGNARARDAFAFRKLKNAGAVLVFGSDSPGTNAARYYLNPKYGLYAAVTRQTLKGEPKEGWFPDQRLTIEEAIEAYTRGPAWASFEEAQKGTLAAGKLADVAVFDTNLVEAGRADPAALLKAEVLYTIAGGKVVFERDARPRPAASAAPDPPGATRRIPQLENESVRVWKSIIAPGQPLTMHRHDAARVIVALRGGTLKVVKPSGESRAMTWETGKAYWLPADAPGETHGDRNEGPDPIEVMVIELRPRP